VPKIGKTIQVATLRATLIGDTKNFTQSMSQASGIGCKFATGLRNIGKAATFGYAIAGAAAVAYGAKAIQNAISVETAWTGVTKTVDGLGGSLADITPEGKKVYDQFRALAKVTPLPIEDLMEIGELAGQLGVGASEVVGFTDIIAKLGLTTNLTTDEAAKQIARLNAIYKVFGEDMVSNTESIGNALVALGNNFATTEGEIMTATLRMAGMGRTVGLAQADIMGLATGLSSLGIPAAMGTTAIGKMFLEMQGSIVGANTHLGLFARTAGMSTKEFKESFEKNAMGSMLSFIKGIGEAGNKGAVILEKLKLGGSRMAQTFLTLAQNPEQLERAIKLANDEFARGNALQVEAEKRYQTTAAQWGMLKNRMRDASILLGNKLLPYLNDLMEAFGGVWSIIVEGDFTGGLAGLFGEKAGAEDSPLVNKLFAIREGLLNLKENIKIFITETLPPLIEKFLEVKNAIMEWLSPIFEFIEQNTSFKDGLIALGIAIATFVLPALWGVLTTMGGLILIFGAVMAVVALLRKVWEEHGDVIKEKAMIAWGWLQDNIPPIIENIKAKILEFVEKVKAWWNKHGEEIISTAQMMWGRIWRTIKLFVKYIVTVVEWFVDLVKGLWERHGEKIIGLFSRTWERVKRIFNSVITFIQSIIKAFIAIFQGDWDGMAFYLQNAWAALWDTVREILEGAWDIIKTAIGALITEVVRIWEDTDWKALGQGIIDGILGGLIKTGYKISDWLKDMAGKAVDAVKDFLGISSPSMVFATEVGKPIMEGWAEGMRRMSHQPLQVAAETAAGSVGMARNFNVTVDAHYQNPQSESNVAKDIETMARLLGYL